MRALSPVWRYAISLAVIAAADAGWRVAVGFEMGRVVAFEAALFLASSALFAVDARRDAEHSRTARRIGVALAVAFGLGGLRAAIWAFGASVSAANLVVLAVGIGLALLYAVWRWRRARSEHTGSAPPL